VAHCRISLSSHLSFFILSHSPQTDPSYTNYCRERSMLKLLTVSAEWLSVDSTRAVIVKARGTEDADFDPT
jgi:hypothetical protein